MVCGPVSSSPAEVTRFRRRGRRQQSEGHSPGGQQGDSHSQVPHRHVCGQAHRLSRVVGGELEEPDVCGCVCFYTRAETQKNPKTILPAKWWKIHFCCFSLRSVCAPPFTSVDLLFSPALMILTEFSVSKGSGCVESQNINSKFEFMFKFDLFPVRTFSYCCEHVLTCRVHPVYVCVCVCLWSLQTQCCVTTNFDLCLLHTIYCLLLSFTGPFLPVTPLLIFCLSSLLWN